MKGDLKMKKFKSIACLILAMLTFMTMFVATASAAELPDEVTLHITKYEVTDSTGNIQMDSIIGNTSTLTGTTADAPTGRTPLDGVTFTIYKVGDLNTAAPKNPDVNDFTKVTTVTTKDGGKADFTVNADNFGLYYVVETSAPAQVTTVAVPFFVYLPMTNEAGTGFMSDVYAYPKNYIPLGGAKLQKLDGDKPLEGVEFKLYKEDGTEVTKDYLGNAIGTLKTDAQGYIKVENLAIGKYYFKETKTIGDYVLKNDPINFEVTVNSVGKLAELTFQNSARPTIDKFVTTEGQKSDITGFNKFADTKQKWIIVAGVPADMDAKVYEQYLITDTMDSMLTFEDDPVAVYVKKGTAYTALPATDFTVSAVDANNTFTVKVTNLLALEGASAVKVEFNTTLKETAATYTNYYNDATLTVGAKNIGEPYTVKVPTPPYVYTGEINFKKTNASNAGLKDAKFDLYVKGEAEPVVTDITSATDGTFVIKGLPLGKYELEETKAPMGYELLSKRYEFEVKKESYTANKGEVNVIINQASVQLPITGGMGTVIFTVAGLGLITLSVVFFVASKKSKKEN